MAQVIMGIFSSYRDAHDALRALQLEGLGRDDAQLYVGHGPQVHRLGPPLPAGAEVARSDGAEYAAHGEHQGTVAPTARSPSRPEAGKKREPPLADVRVRTLLVIKAATALKLSAVREVLHAYGASAVRDPNGKWHFSPYATPSQ